jgi:GNAT superfamily N-acetyltransferase
VRLELLSDVQHVREHPSWARLWSVWPEFMSHDPVANDYFPRIRTELAHFQLVLLDDDEPLAHANTIPVRWDGRPEPRGIDWALENGFGGDEPTTLCALQVMIQPGAQGGGISRTVLEGMVGLAREHGLDALIAPVRPTLKHRYPLIPVDRYAAWRREDDGLLFDPWLRTHERLGATVFGIAEESMTVPGTAEDWERWTEMQFPEDGDYVVPGALVPVRFENGRGLYVEPNIWMRHPVD